MKKIVLVGDNREINITSLEEVVDIYGIVNELIVPSFSAFGFSKGTILDGLENYLEEHRPEENDQLPCTRCEDLAEQLFRLQKNYEIVYGQNVDYGDRIDKLVKQRVELAKQIVTLRNRQEAEDNGNPIEAPVNEAPEEVYQCEGCAEYFVLKDLDRDYGMCEVCFEKFTCSDCGKIECECDACPDCGQDSENGGGELCNNCQIEYDGEGEGDCIRTAPSFGPEDICLDCGNKNDDCDCEIYQPKPKVPVNRVPDNNIWNTGQQSTVRDGWTVPPNEVTVEPEQEDIPEPKINSYMTCPNCGKAMQTEVTFCPECGYHKEDVEHPCETCKGYGTPECLECSEIDDFDKPIINRKEFMATSYQEVEPPEIVIIPVPVPVPTHCPKCENDISMYDNVKFCPLCGFDISEPVEELKPVPVEETGQMNAVGVWNTKELEKEQTARTVPTPVQESDHNCISCGTNMVEHDNDEFACPKCDYRTDCECNDCQNKRGKLVEVDNEHRYNKAIIALEDVEKLRIKGMYDPTAYEGKRVNCDNIKQYFPEIDCSQTCNRCPVGKHTMAHSLKFGIYCCNSCHIHLTKPFPQGFCPDCGIHDDGEDKDEFCGTHWDVNRAKSGYSAEQEENHKDSDNDD